MKDKVLKTFKKLGFSDVAHANRSTLLEHCVRVSDLLSSWNESEELCSAAYFHSIYGRGGTSFAPLPLSRRADIQDLIGPKAERLAYLNCAMTSESFWRCFQLSRVPYTENQKFHIFDRFEKSEIAVDGKDLTDLLRLNYANMYDHIDFQKPIEDFKWAELSLYVQFFEFLSPGAKKQFLEIFRLNQVAI